MSEPPQTPQQEERYPLLFLFLDDGNKGAKKGRNVFFERGRSQGIITGASNVLTQWPGYISSCGLTMIVLILTVLFLFLMIIACSIRPTDHSLRPRCIKKSFDDKSDIGLYLVHNDDAWNPKQLTVLEEILSKYNQCDIELLLLRDDSLSSRTYRLDRNRRLSKGRPKRHLLPFKNAKNINVGSKSVLQAFKEKKKFTTMSNNNDFIANQSSIHPFLMTTAGKEPVITLESVIKKYPKLTLTNTTKRQFFEMSPLYNSWKTLSKPTLNFAARVLRLWENAGISFELPETSKSENSSDYYKYDIVQENTLATVTSRIVTRDDQMKIIESMIDVGYTSFKNLPEGLVTVDEEGIHMETKTTCHAFFGEALNQLRHATGDTTVRQVIKDTLKTFCIKGAVDSEYCSNIKSQTK